MPIVKTGPGKGKGHSLNDKIRCWECGSEAAAFVISPSSGRQLCQKCAPRDFVGVEEVKKRAKTPRSG